MAEADIKRIANEIYANIGGPENVEKLIHCMTRVRITIRDPQKVDMDGLKKIDGVLGVVDDDTLQVVVGPGVVNKVADEMVDQVGVKLGDTFPSSFSDKELAEQKAKRVKAEQKSKQKQTPIKRILKSIANIFVPLIPVFVGAGLIGGIAAVLSNLMVAGDISKSWSELIMVLNVLKNSLFAYLVIYVGINSATEFGATPGLGGVIGAVTLLSGVDPKQPLHNIFNGQPLTSGQGGIIGVIFAVWVLSLVEKRLHKVIPDSIDIIITPTVSLIIIGLFTIFIVMPVAGVISNSLVGAIDWVLNVGGAFAGFVLGTAFLPMVMLGLHQILTPIHIEMINKTGITPLLPILAMAGAGQVGAAIALWIKAKNNKQLTKLIKGSLPVGILGIGEPLIYGVTLPLGRPFITACIGGGIGGAVVGGLGHIGSIAIGPSGVALIPLIRGGNHMIGYILGLLAGYLGGFIITYFFGVPQDVINPEPAVETSVESTTTEPLVPEAVTTTSNVTTELFSLVDGKMLPITEVDDPTFSQKMLGDGYAVEPINGNIVSPVDGTIETIFPTKHAIGIRTEAGLEVLIHMGIDTVNLKGVPFEIDVTTGQKVSHGTLLAKADLETIKNSGKATTMMVIITNMDAVKRLEIDPKTDVQANDNVGNVTTK